ncbi:hypothetical protein ACJRO7_009912 [Eucalyptus globulus]|uniref:Cell number regulator 2-like n=1 Tax=Eucalyptus globulus TaxID=34317 RepID=A0ABD3LDV4_EUCGL
MSPNNASGNGQKSPPAGAVPEQWTTGLCDCFDDPRNCIVTCCCPCITFGQNAEIIDRGATSCFIGGLIFCLLAQVGVACLYTCSYRTKLRGLHSLPGDSCDDCLLHWCCIHCALCQEYRELKNHGLDPSIGWVANAEKMNRGATTMPPMTLGMDR